tara:strand:+ start:1144 stop:1329 length:186 start_codon:yes stop_codon:yes gene_type:complete
MNFKKTKTEVVKATNPSPTMKASISGDVVFAPFVVKDNKGPGPKGQTSRQQIKKVAFKGVK